MAEKKLKKLSKRSDKTSGIKESASQIWLAGLGAFARAQDEGSKIFDSLVKEGEKLESKGRKATSARVNEVRGAMEGTVSQVQARASQSLDKLEKVFEERVARALGALGVPTAGDIKELSDRVEDLQKAVDEYKGGAAAKKTTTKKATAKKASAKKKTAKKTASKS